MPGGDFSDATARDQYLAHAAHRAVGAALVAAVAGGVEGLLVLDFVLPPEGAPQARR